MKIALIGASGFVGSKIRDEALQRGHQVTAVVRNPDKLPQRPNLQAKKGDIFNPDDLAEQLKDHDVVVSAVHFTETDFDKLLEAVKKSDVPRYIAVGGAGSLDFAPGSRLVDQPFFPSEYYPEAKRGSEFLDLLRQQKDLNWTMLSPSAEVYDGERTGVFRLGKDDLLSATDGRSHISTQDYAIAMLDEIEKPQHEGERFTVGY